MVHLKNDPISNITTSEGQLWRYTLITNIIGPKGHKEIKEIMKKMESELGLTNNRVRLNHLCVTRKLAITKCSGDMQRHVLRGPGKALYYFWENEGKPQKKFLSPWEKAFYFRGLFLYHFDQFYQFLLNLEGKSGQTTEEIILDYFNHNRIKKLNIIDPETLGKSVRSWNSNKTISRHPENIFKCMEAWLRQLGLIKRGNGPEMSEKAKEIISSLKRSTKPEEHLKGNVYRFLVPLLDMKVANVKTFDYSNPQHKGKLHELLRDSYNSFRDSFGTADLEAARCRICTEMLIDKLVFEEEKFNQLLNTLVNEGVIKSVIGTEHGELRHFVL